MILNVPVYSGEARASLLPLGRYLRVKIDVRPTINARKQRRYAGAIEKGVSQGQDAYHFTSSGTATVFRFDINVPHYFTNELNKGLGQPPLIHPTPWRSLDAGSSAFKQYMHENLKNRIPKILDYVIRTNLNG